MKKLLLIILVLIMGCTKPVIEEQAPGAAYEKYNQPPNNLTDWLIGNYQVVAWWTTMDTDSLPSSEMPLLNYLNSIEGIAIEDLNVDDNQKITHSMYYDKNQNGIIDVSDIAWFGNPVGYKNPPIVSYERHACYSSGWTVDYLSSIMILGEDHEVFNVDYVPAANSILIRGALDEVGYGYCDDSFNSVTISIDLIEYPWKLVIVYAKIPK